MPTNTDGQDDPLASRCDGAPNGNGHLRLALRAALAPFSADARGPSLRALTHDARAPERAELTRRTELALSIVCTWLFLHDRAGVGDVTVDFGEGVEDTTHGRVRPETVDLVAGARLELAQQIDGILEGPRLADHLDRIGDHLDVVGLLLEDVCRSATSTRGVAVAPVVRPLAHTRSQGDSRCPRPTEQLVAVRVGLDGVDNWQREFALGDVLAKALVGHVLDRSTAAKRAPGLAGPRSTWTPHGLAPRAAGPPRQSSG